MRWIISWWWSLFLFALCIEKVESRIHCWFLNYTWIDVATEGELRKGEPQPVNIHVETDSFQPCKWNNSNNYTHRLQLYPTGNPFLSAMTQCPQPLLFSSIHEVQEFFLSYDLLVTEGDFPCDQIHGSFADSWVNDEWVIVWKEREEEDGIRNLTYAVIFYTVFLTAVGCMLFEILFRIFREWNRTHDVMTQSETEPFSKSSALLGVLSATDPSLSDSE